MSTKAIRRAERGDHGRQPGAQLALDEDAEEEGGEEHVEPERAGSPIRPPAKTPITVPPTQHGYDGMVAPSMNQGSKRPPPRLAAAHEKSIIA